MKTTLALLALVSGIANAQAWHTPARGSVERAQVMAALRTNLSKLDPAARNMRFVVRELCLSDRSGWIVADPRSADGRNQYEPAIASLGKRNGQWVVDRIACEEEECPTGTSSEEIRSRLDPGCR